MPNRGIGDQELTLAGLAGEVRVAIATLQLAMADIQTAIAGLQANTERRGGREDLRAMIREEVSGQIGEFVAELRAMRDEMAGKLAHSLAFDAKIQVLVNEYDERVEREKSRDRRSARTEKYVRDVKPWLMAIVTYLLSSKAQSIGAIPQGVFMGIMGVAVFVALIWPAYRAYTRRDDGPSDKSDSDGQ